MRFTARCEVNPCETERIVSDVKDCCKTLLKVIGALLRCAAALASIRCLVEHCIPSLSPGNRPMSEDFVE